jgi:threonine dehydrogenase-like Zn-dependent dehydrogenase
MRVGPQQSRASLSVRLQYIVFASNEHLLRLAISLPGHENLGIVEELGEGVTLLKKGDRVVMPFNVADGRCRNCEEGKTAFCTGVNPGFAGGAYGLSDVIDIIMALQANNSLQQDMLPWDPILEV